MATPLDVGLLGNFQIIFPFLFIFSIVFGMLTYTKFLGDNKVVSALIAIVLSFMALFSDIVVETINTAAPWFVLLIVFIVFLMLAFMILGVKEGDFVGVLKNPEFHRVTILDFGLWTLDFGVSRQAIGQQEHRIVGAHVTIHGDPIKTVRYSFV